MEKPTSSGAIVAAYVLAAIALLAWLILVPGLTSLDSSDAAGNAMAQGLTALVAIVVWALLAIVALLCWAKGQMPTWAGLAALLLVPGSCVAAFSALELLGHSNLPPFGWPVFAIAAPPPLILAVCLWAITPPLRERLPANAVCVPALGRGAGAVAVGRADAGDARRRPAEAGGRAGRVARRGRRHAGRRAAVAMDAPARARLLRRRPGHRNDPQARPAPGRRRGDAQARRFPARRSQPLRSRSDAGGLRRRQGGAAGAGRAARRRQAAGAALCRRFRQGRGGARGDELARRLRLRGRRGVAGLADDGRGLPRSGLDDPRTRRSARSQGARPDVAGIAGEILAARSRRRGCGHG